MKTQRAEIFDRWNIEWISIVGVWSRQENRLQVRLRTKHVCRGGPPWPPCSIYSKGVATEGHPYELFGLLINLQFTNLRNCTLIANPIAIKVAIREASPALISGKGTPMTGEIPSAIPIS